jgi:phage terminase large subunit-like protein
MAGEPPKSVHMTALKEKILRRTENKLKHYEPYPKQIEFHAAGAQYRERMLKAGNQQGKTMCAGFEIAMHLTGIYPPDWIGKMFNKPTAGWASGVTGESTRDNPQRILLGRKGQYGTGSIPKHLLLEVTSARGVSDAVDTVMVKHVTGGVSILNFKSYEKGREKWQGETLDFVWFDEEPPLDVYIEGLTRTNTTGGVALITYTPLLGMSQVTCRYLKEPSPDRICVSMTIHDALHYTEAERTKIIASYPAHEREARANGVPILGSGRIFPVSKESIIYSPMAFPGYFRRLCGMDFGWDHPTAAVWIAYDPDADCVYIYDAYRKSEATPVIHTAAMRARGTWIPVAWPHDGLQHDKGSGEQLAQQYRDHGLNMLPERATFMDGGNGVEAGLMDMLDRMHTGRLKVAEHLNDWFEEFLLYHRKDGKVVKEGDDLMSATRYALMMLREAITQSKTHMPESWRARLNRAKTSGSAQSA